MNETPLKKARPYGPDVILTTRGDLRLVRKTFKNRNLPVRLLGTVLIAWERFIYSRLQGLQGIPQLAGEQDHYTITTTFMGGQNLRETKQLPDEDYYVKLERLINAMHARGVRHLDLRNRRNYGLDDEGNPYLVDFASCLYVPWRRSTRDFLAEIDRMGFLKVKAKTNPEFVSADEHRRLERGNRLSDLWLPGKLPELLRRLARATRN